MPFQTMADLKLIALEKDDVTVFSAHLQDAVLRVADLVWMPREKRFVMIVNRFNWSADTTSENERRRSVLRFEHVLSAQVQGLDLNAKDTVLSLLSISFEETDSPGGRITLIFAGDGAVGLDVECVEGEICDLGAAWRTRSRPSHSIVADNNDTSFDSDT